MNIIDAMWVGSHFWESTITDCPTDKCCYLWSDPEADGADLNNDCVINIIDAVIVGTNWEHVAWKN